MPNGRLLHEVYRNNNDCTLICGWSIRMQMKQKRIRKRNTKENAHKENRKRGPSHTTARGRHPGNVQRRRVEGIDMEMPCPLNSAPCETGEGTTSYIICLQSSSRRMETDLILTNECGEPIVVYQTAGDANANIFVFEDEVCTCSIEEYPGEDDADTILADRSSTPTGVGGGAEEAGEVDDVE